MMIQVKKNNVKIGKEYKFIFLENMLIFFFFLVIVFTFNKRFYYTSIPINNQNIRSLLIRLCKILSTFEQNKSIRRQPYIQYQPYI
jgi:hypothetical protein